MPFLFHFSSHCFLLQYARERLNYLIYKTSGIYLQKTSYFLLMLHTSYQFKCIYIHIYWICHRAISTFSTNSPLAVIVAHTQWWPDKLEIRTDKCLQYKNNNKHAKMLICNWNSLYDNSTKQRKYCYNNNSKTTITSVSGNNEIIIRTSASEA